MTASITVPTGIVGLALIGVVLWDAFETMILPRRINRRVRLTRAFYFATWPAWSRFARHSSEGRRETYLGIFGPLVFILLLGIWALGLIVGFALLQWSLDPHLNTPDGVTNFGTHLYMSGTTLFTLGFGDVTPRPGPGRPLAVLEAGIGLAFLASVIAYLPVMYQSFSRREVQVSLLDARAGSPPSAVELLRRYGDGDDTASLSTLLADWERWSAELLESHLSYPVLGFFRSQHENESWIAALTTILDVCALVMVGIDGFPAQPARFSFAMARHAAVDLSQVYGIPPHDPHVDRLPPADLARLRAILIAAGVPLREGPAADAKLAHLRRLYEPYVNAMSERLLMSLPPWLPPEQAADNWKVAEMELADRAGSVPEPAHRA